MHIKKIVVCLMLAASVLLSGCNMLTVDQMYKLPRRSEDYNNLQSAIDSAIVGLEYCAPLAGENRQTVHMADLDGDGDQEYLLFAKSNAERPLRILIFNLVDGTYVHMDTIESNGSAFDQVEYVQMDNRGGLELVVGSQLSDQVLRSVSVYTFSGGSAEQLVSANYSKFLTVDLDMDKLAELFVLRPGQTDTDNGVAELYGVENGVMERSNEVNMSASTDKLKRVLIGKLHDGETAVYVASAVENTALITDVYAYIGGKLDNVSFSNEFGTSVNTLRNYYIYAADIDNDGVVELPALVSGPMIDMELSGDRRDLIRWYAMKSDGTILDKRYTYHELVGGWYLELDSRWAAQAMIVQQGNCYELLLWLEDYEDVISVASIWVLTGNNRDAQSQEANRFVLYKTDSVTYAASLGVNAGQYGITQESLLRAFHMIRQEWKTGET